MRDPAEIIQQMKQITKESGKGELSDDVWKKTERTLIEIKSKEQEYVIQRRRQLRRILTEEILPDLDDDELKNLKSEIDRYFSEKS